MRLGGIVSFATILFVQIVAVLFVAVLFVAVLFAALVVDLQIDGLLLMPDAADTSGCDRPSDLKADERGHAADDDRNI